MRHCALNFVLGILPAYSAQKIGENMARTKHSFSANTKASAPHPRKFRKLYLAENGEPRESGVLSLEEDLSADANVTGSDISSELHAVPIDDDQNDFERQQNMLEGP